MLSDRILAFLENQRLLVVSWSSLIRIAAWVVVGVITFGLLVPDRAINPDESAYRAQISAPSVQDVSAQRGDERGFTSTSGDGVFRIAWIAGSSIQGVDPQRRTFVPGEIGQRLTSVDGEPVAIDMYFLSGMRILDEYSAVLEAVESAPDMIIVTLNPIWALNDRAVQGWDNLDGQLFSALASTPSAWPLLGTITSPSDMLWATAGQRFDSFDDRYHWGLRLSDRFASSSLLDVSRDVPDVELTELQQIAAMQIPIFFWDRYSNIIDSEVVGPDRQTALFDYAASVDSGINEYALGGLFDALHDANVPAYVYVAQIDDEVLSDSGVSDALARVEQRLAEIGRRNTESLVTFEHRSVTRIIPDMNFRDMVHLLDVDELTDHLLEEICSVLQDQGKSADCE